MQRNGRILPKMQEWRLRLPLEESKKQSVLETICLDVFGVAREMTRMCPKTNTQFAPQISRPSGMLSPRLLRLMPFYLSEN